ncbi:MAG: PEP-CTERM system histidine kinase PrsK, partial [Rubrivivax sp.]
MNLPPFDVASAGYAFGLAAHLVLALVLARRGRPVTGAPGARRPVLAAALASAAWCAASLLSVVWNDRAADYLTLGTDLLRYALWFLFLVMLLPRNDDGSPSAAARLMRRVAAGSLAVAGGLMVVQSLGVLAGDWSRLAIGGALALPVCGLLMVEQLFRNLREDQRWNAKPVCLGLACVFVFDVYLFSEGLLFAKLDTDALAVRGAVHALAVPFLLVAARRSPNWIAKLHVSRAAAFYSASLLLAVGVLAGDWSRLAIGGALALPVCGLLMVEQLFRNLREDQRWNAKP